MIDAYSAIVGSVCGIISTRFYLWAEPRVIRAYRKWKAGICFRYQPTGIIENRDGTISDFCRKCGHPYGYHWGE